MEKIQMVDLKSQYQKIKPEIDKSIQNIIDTTAFVKGSEVKEFEKELSEYLNVKHTISCGNGTDALQIAMMALDLKPEDEIITTGFTFIATVEAIALLGLTPIMVDVNPKTFCIDPEEIEKAITPKTKAIVPVHLFGQCADMDKITEIAKKHDLYIIEDTAQAIGADYFFKNRDKIESQKAGTIGHIGCTSFFPSKNLGCYGDGGAIFTNDDQIAEKLRSIVNHGMEKRYYHDRIGVNSRLDGIQAAVLRVKLPHLDQYNQARKKAADFYDKHLSQIPQLEIPYRNPNSTHTFHQYTLLIRNADRNKLKEYLNEKNIPAMIYYPVPMHKQKAYKDFIGEEKKFEITEKLCQTVLSLPMHTELTEEQQIYICNSISEFFEV